MKYTVVPFLLCSTLPFSLLAGPPVDRRHEYKKETEGIAKSFQKLIGGLFEGDLLEQDQLLPEEEKGKRFNPPASNSTSPLEACPFEKEIVQALERTQTIAPIDPDELFLQQSLTAKNWVEGSLGLTTKQNHTGALPANKESCSEGVSQTIAIEEDKQEEAVPEATQEVLYCREHVSTQKKYWKKDAEKLRKQWESELRRDASIACFEAKITDGKGNSSYKVKKKWRHKEGVRCDRNGKKTMVTSSATTTITWVPQDQELFLFLENNPHCTQVASSMPTSARRRRLFRCDPPNDGGCERIRARGGQLLEKICLERDPNGKCILFEKSYATPQLPSVPELDYRFDREENAIWGLNELQIPTTQDEGFQQAISTLYAVSEIEGSSPNKSDPQQVEIFPGQVRRCKSSILGRAVDDCCGVPCKRKNELGVALALGLAGCSQEEKMLFDARKNKKCSFVGKRVVDLGAFSERTYICFPSILSRIIQEAAKTQLGRSFGTPNNPNPEGLSLSELQQLNFDIIDLSDFIEELQEKIDPKAIASILKERIASFDNKQSESQTQTLLKGQQAKCDF